MKNIALVLAIIAGMLVTGCETKTADPDSGVLEGTVDTKREAGSTDGGTTAETSVEAGLVGDAARSAGDDAGSDASDQ
jgi:hypothetical protein